MGSPHLRKRLTRTELEHLYCQLGLTDAAIARRVGATPEGIRLYRHRCGIASNLRRHALIWIGGPSAAQLKYYYLTLGWSDMQIALKFDVDRTTIRDRRHRLGILPACLPSVTTEQERQRGAAKQRERRAAERAAAGRHTRAEWRAKLAEFDNRCAYCGRRLRKLTKDHRVPIARGGSNDIENIVPACLRCNASKGTAVWHLAEAA